MSLERLGSGALAVFLVVPLKITGRANFEFKSLPPTKTDARQCGQLHNAHFERATRL